jgi:putative Mg2+ transporter-C (MgtC) family protein
VARTCNQATDVIQAELRSAIGFLGAGVIFKDSGSVHGLNTAATIWCSAAIGAISGLGNPLHALILTAAVLTTNIVLRPLAYRLYPAQASGPEQEVTYGFELICRPEDEAHMRALLLQAMSRSSLTLTGLRSEDIEGTSKMKVIGIGAAVTHRPLPHHRAYGSVHGGSRKLL